MKIRLSHPGLLSFAPLAGFLWLLFYVYVAYLQVGHWPSYGRPDPTNIGPWLTGYALMGILLAFMYGSPVALGVLLWTLSRRVLREVTARGKIRQWAALAGYLSVFAIGAVLFATALFRLREWLID